MRILGTIITILIILIISCENKSVNQKSEENSKPKLPKEFKAIITDRNVYDDIDLFILKGVNQITIPSSYPYIKIDSLQKNQKRVVYKYSNKDSSERIYTKKNDYWTTSHEFKADTGYSIIYEYIWPEKIIELEYDGTYKKTNYHLRYASLIEKNKQISWGFRTTKGFNIAPQPGNLEIMKEKGNTIITDTFYTRNGILSFTSRSFEKGKNETRYSNSSCYDVNGHSWFWWRYFGLQKNIDCKK